MNQRLPVQKSLLTVVFLAVLALGSAAADGLRMGGYMIQTSYLGIQTWRTTDGDTDDSGVTVNEGPWWVFDQVGARTQINFSYNSGDLSFSTSFRLDEQLLSSTFNSADLSDINPLNTANLTYRLLDGQIKVRTGLYQEEGLGFNLDAYATGTMGRYLASSHGGGTDSNYLTSVELAPEALPGLAVLVGVPIAPNVLVLPNKVTTDDPAYNDARASNVYKRFRIAAKWDLPDVGLVHAYWYNALYSQKTTDAAAGFVINHAGEGLQEGMIGIENLAWADAQWKLGYVFNWATVAAPDAFQHSLTISTKTSPLAGVVIAADDTVTGFNRSWAIAADTYPGSGTSSVIHASSAEWAEGKWGLWNKVQVNTTVDLKPWTLGLNTAVVYEPFSNAHYALWGQPTAELVNGDVGRGSELVGVANPFLRLAIGQGTATLGLNLYYDAKTVGSQTNRAVGWQVPLDFFLWF